jgi:hypothetical protein
LGLIQETLQFYPMRILAYRILPNHWHFLLNRLFEGPIIPLRGKDPHPPHAPIERVKHHPPWSNPFRAWHAASLPQTQPDRQYMLLTPLFPELLQTADQTSQYRRI